MNKKSASVLAVLLALMTLCACGAPAADDAPLADVMERILTDVPELPSVQNIEITDDNFEFYLFIPPIEGAQALASEAMISAVAHSVVLLRLPSGSDANAVAEQIRAAANPRKWICVEAEKTLVSVNGNTVLLVMSTAAIADAVSANFLGR